MPRENNKQSAILREALIVAKHQVPDAGGGFFPDDRNKTLQCTLVPGLDEEMGAPGQKCFEPMISQSTLWKKLLAHAEKLADIQLRELFAKEKNRHARHVIELDGLLLDFSKNLFTAETLGLLAALAKASNLFTWRDRFFSGGMVNKSEEKAALHAAMRDDGTGPAAAAGISEKARHQVRRMLETSSAVRQQEQTGFNGRCFSDIVNIGVGGSHLGVAMACVALQPFAGKNLKIHFLATLDTRARNALFSTLNPERTLFIVTSKSFATRETLMIANHAKALLCEHFGSTQAWQKHFLAVTARRDRAIHFGIPAESCLEIWDTIGGRFSIWSAAGLAVAIQIGARHYAQMQEGARLMDRHFASTPLLQNMPVILALLGILNENFLGLRGHAVLAYEPALAMFPDFLQQLHMESNGKEVNHDGNNVDYATSPAVWGADGITVQHSYGQILHQGPQATPVDFICAACPQEKDPDSTFLAANCFAQSYALMSGRSGADPARNNPGNRPSNTIMLKQLTPKTLGMLIALYEHKVFTQSVIWQINPFDQWGVELGKEITDRVLQKMAGTNVPEFDDSTNGLLNRYRNWKDC